MRSMIPRGPGPPSESESSWAPLRSPMSPRIRPPPANTSVSIRGDSCLASNPPGIRSSMPVGTPMKSRVKCAAALRAPSSTGVELMPNGGSWFKRVGAWILVPIWAWRTPVKPLRGGPRPSIQPADNLQSMMNLIMPLKRENKSPIGRAKAALAIAENKDQIFAGLDNVGTVHFARFVIVNDNICMFSVYDGDFSNYIRDFIATIGGVFDAVVG